MLFDELNAAEGKRPVEGNSSGALTPAGTPPPQLSDSPSRSPLKRTLADMQSTDAEEDIVEEADVIDDDDDDDGDGGGESGSQGWSIDIIGQDHPERLDPGRDAGDEAMVKAGQLPPRPSDPELQRLMYKVETHVKLSPVDENAMEADVDCTTAASSRGFALAMGKQVYLLNSSCADHQATVNLDHPQEMMAFNRDSTFLVVGDSLGAIHFIHVETHIVVFTHEIAEEHQTLDAVEKKAFLRLGFVNRPKAETEELLVVLSNRTLFRFSNVNLAKVDNAMKTGNMSLAMEAKRDISVEQLDLKQDANAAIDQVRDVLPLAGKGPERIVIAGKGRQPLTIWQRSKRTLATTKIDGVARILANCELVRAEFASRGKYLITLDAAGTLSVWDFKTLIILYQWYNTDIADFNVIDAPPASRRRLGELFIFALSTKKGDMSRCIRVIALPRFRVEHSIRVSSNCWLVKSGQKFTQRPSDAEDDRLYFVEGERETRGIRTTNIFVRSLSETVPIHRFEQLIRQKRFPEAEIFAREYDLDLQVVAQAKLHSALAELNVRKEWGDDELENLLRDILSDLQQVKDDAFAIDFCLKAMLPTDKAVYRLLSHARLLVLDRDKHANGTTTLDASFNVHHAIRRLGTFQLLSSMKLSTEPAAESLVAFDCAEWQRFRVADLALEMQELMRAGNLQSAIVVWRRHYLDENLLDKLADILSDVPDGASPKDFVPWLKHEVLPVVQRSDHRASLAAWTEQRARTIELQQKRPHDALAVIKLIDLAVGPEKHNGVATTDAQLFCPPTPAHYVDNAVASAQTSHLSHNANIRTPSSGLRAQLEDLVYLWDVHGFRLSLNDYCQNSPGSIAVALLDRVAATELLQDAITRHFLPYVERHELDYDGLLNDYSMDLMDSLVYVGSVKGSVKSLVEGESLSSRKKQMEAEVDKVVAAPWEARVLAVVDCMTSNHWKTQVILEALRWPGQRHAEELRAQYGLLKLKRMLLGYGITGFNISDKSLARGLLRKILSRTDLPHAMDDAMRVIGAYHHLTKMEAYRIRVVNLCDAGLIDRAINLLKFGREDGEADAEMEAPDACMNETSDGPEVDCRLDRVQAMGVAKEVIFYLKHMMDAAVYENSSNRPSAAFSLAVDCAIRIAEFVQTLAKELLISADAEQLRHRTSSSLLSSSYPEAAAADPSVYGMEHPVVVFKNIKALSEEFGIMMKVDEYNDSDERRKLLGTFAKKVYKYNRGKDGSNEERDEGKGKGKGKGKSTLSVNGAGPSQKSPDEAMAEHTQTSLYRVAEVLGFERGNLQGILAEEAARNGDFRTALVICKELYDKFPDEKTAQVLKRIARFLTNYAAENENVYRDVKESKMNYRLTSRIVELSEQAVTVCSQDTIASYLDDFKNYEIQHSIFTQCDAGDYEASVAREYPADGDQFMHEAASSMSYGAGSSSTGASSSSLHPPPTPMPSTLATEPTDMELANIDDGYADCLFEERYHETGLVLSTERAMALASSFVLDTAVSEEAESGDSAFGFVSRKAKGVQRALPQDSGKILAEDLLANRVPQMALRVWQRAQEAKFRKGVDPGTIVVRPEDGTLHRTILNRLLVTVLRSEFVDEKLGFGYMISLPQSEGFDSWKAGMQLFYHEFNRIVRIGSIGVRAGLAWNQSILKHDGEKLMANGQWWQQLSLLDIQFDHQGFRDTAKDNSHVRDLVGPLLERTQLDVETTLEFARRYHIEGHPLTAVPDDFVLLEYIKQLLLPSVEEPAANTWTYQIRVAGVLDDVANKEKLYQLLEDCLQEVSLYDYERIRFIHSQILRLKPDHDFVKIGNRILDILTDYVRTAPPVEEELTWLTLKEPILKAELNEDSLGRLLPLHIPLNALHIQVNSDNMHALVLENICFAMKQQNTANESELDRTQSACKPFTEIKPLILRIKNEELAVRQAVAVGGQYPIGPERLAAYRFALPYLEKLPESDVSRNRLKQMLIAGEIEAQLESMGLLSLRNDVASSLGYNLEVQPQPLLLAGREAQLHLVKLLYETQSERALRETLDIHGLVNGMVKGCGMGDPDGIRGDLVNELLRDKVHISPEQRENYLPSVRAQINNELKSPEETAIQIRLLYLLRSYDLKDAIETLWKFANKPTAKISTLNRIRALSVLLLHADPENISAALARSENVARSFSDVKNYMKSLLYLADFEELRIVQTIKEFEDCDKEAFVRSLWVSHRNDARAVQLICNICLDYDIYDLTLWENALHKLLEKRLYRYVLGILEHFSSVPQLGQMRSLPRLWNNVMLGCLREVADGKESNRAMYGCVVSLIQRCPFLAELNIEAFVEQFRLIEKAAASEGGTVKSVGTIDALCGISALPRSATTQKVIQEIVATLSHQGIVAVLDSADSTGKSDGTNSAHAMDLWIGKNNVLPVIYERLNETREYRILDGTPHLPGLVRHLVQTHNIEHLLVSLLKAQKNPAALALVGSYYRKHPSRLRQDTREDGAETSTLDDFDPQGLLVEYLKSHQFDEDENGIVQSILDEQID
ncbi:hypothetical protein HK104_008726 [Borealophlyctis nickersoniae]|nr:hypothetical protein HK104_008726 [Borealophlyctis nickersoniae]